MINDNYLYSAETSKIIGCAIEVHKSLGTGFQEAIYQRALEYEFELQGLGFAREVEVPIYYKQKQIGLRRVDFLIKSKIIVELKATSQLESVHLAQAINYLEAFNLPIGLLLNFGSTKLQFHRLNNKKHIP